MEVIIGGPREWGKGHIPPPPPQPIDKDLIFYELVESYAPTHTNTHTSDNLVSKIYIHEYAIKL